jgi:hypothetical protein
MIENEQTASKIACETDCELGTLSFIFVGLALAQGLLGVASVFLIYPNN